MKRILQELPVWFSKGFFVGLGFAFAISITSLLAVTISGTINTFASGDVVSASKINENFSSLESAIKGIPLGTYCGSSSASTGNAGSYTAIKALCTTACGNSNAHVCTGHEMALSQQNGVAIPAITLWTVSYLQVDNAGALVSDCNGWTSNSAAVYGPIHNISGYGGKGGCNASLGFACCL
ncbi:MAG: hypothetical protein KDK39_08620 [Leptospiraceae bacterium]|nr:hypothetical protein [Leptospiraceae bacterium]